MKIIAHRGASGYAPENTIAAIQEALEQKVDGIELDVRRTKDGEIVVIHDATIRRTSNGTGYVYDYTLEELKAFDFGSWFSDDYKNERIPTLKEVLELVKDEDILLNIEIKLGPFADLDAGIEHDVIRLVEAYDCTNKVLITAFNHPSLQTIQKLNEDIKLSFILHTNLIDPFHYIEHSQIKPYAIQPNHIYMTQEMVDEAHKRNIKVTAATVDSKSFGEKYKRMGIDYLLTNQTKKFL